MDVARGLLGAVGGRIRSAAARGIQIGADILLGEGKLCMLQIMSSSVLAPCA